MAIAIVRAWEVGFRAAAAWVAVTAACLRDQAAPVARRVWLWAAGRTRAVLALPAADSVRQMASRAWVKAAPHLSWAVEKVRAVLPGDVLRRSQSAEGRPVPAREQALRIGLSAAAVGVVALTVGAVAATARHSAPTANAATTGILHGSPGAVSGSPHDTTRTPEPKPGSASESTPNPATPDTTAKALSTSTKDSPAPGEPGPEYGVDVSNYNGAVNWKNVAAHGKRFAFVEATDGEGFTNPLFRSQFDGAKNARLLVGAYHFARPSGSASDQADSLLSTIKYESDGKTLPPVLDLEVNPAGGACYGLSEADMRNWVTTFSSRVRDATGTDVILYANSSFWNQCMGDTDAFKSTNPLSLAAYGSGAPAPPGGWDHYTFWQNSQSGRVDGIDGDVDLDVFNGSLDQLRKFTHKKDK